jgi:hypothetical protein
MELKVKKVIKKWNFFSKSVDNFCQIVYNINSFEGKGASKCKRFHSNKK